MIAGGACVGRISHQRAITIETKLPRLGVYPYLTGLGRMRLVSRLGPCEQTGYRHWILMMRALDNRDGVGLMQVGGHVVRALDLGL